VDPERLDRVVSQRELVLELDRAAGKVSGQGGGDDRLTFAASLDAGRFDRVAEAVLVAFFQARTAVSPRCVSPSSSTTASAAKQATAASSFLALLASMKREIVAARGMTRRASLLVI
jgi:hypothetical protein